VTNNITLKTAIRTALMGSVLVAGSQTAFAGEKNLPRKPQQVLFGDLHVHTNYSLDSYLFNNANDPNDAYLFAKGEKALPIGNCGDDAAPDDCGETLRISAPLDFAAVTDHAETMAEYLLCTVSPSKQGEPDCDDVTNPNREGWEKSYCSDDCKGVRDLDTSLFTEVQTELQEDEPQRREDICPSESEICHTASETIWKRFQKIANLHNKSPNFTAFIGYEHSPYFTGGGKFHRNIIFRGTLVPENVLSAYDVYTAHELLEQLDHTCTGKCEALVIPHNPNLSNGMFFATMEPKTPDGKEHSYSLEDYERRSRLEPLIEIHQVKGNSECRLGLGTTDEFCQFEEKTHPCDGFVHQEPGFNCLEDSYVRNGLKKGLKLAEENTELNGLNPFKYGFIGSTDTHNATPGLTAEFQPVGGSPSDATPEARLEGGSLNNPGGLAGVWVEKNTRGAIFDALKRKEAFGTSGSRIKVRFFAGWDYPSNLHKYPSESMLQTAYEKGVPMGGDINDDLVLNQPEEPRFLVWAAKDPLSANLQRLQIIKGWTDTDGTHEKVYDVACSDGLVPDSSTYRCPDNGVQVDLKTCNYSEFKGASELKATWTDPEFDSSHRAFYYARILENPTCRWSTYDANTLGIEPLKEVSPTVQERAWSSPIWYTPSTTAIKADKIGTAIQEDKKAVINKLLNLLKAKKPLLQALIEQLAAKRYPAQKLSTRQIGKLLQGKTVTYLNRRDGSTSEVLFTQKGKRELILDPDYMVSTPYEIRDDQLYERSGRDKEHGTSIYQVRGDSQFHYITCDSRDNGYCNWEIILKSKKR